MRGGFTLVEVIVAVTLTAIASGIAVGVFTAVADSLTSISIATEARDREFNGRAWLRDAFDSMHPMGTGDEGFRGDRRTMSFTTSLWGSAGQMTPTRLQLGFDERALLAWTGEDGPVVLFDGVLDGRFEYVVTQGATVPASSRWESRVLPPLAVRVLLTRAKSKRAIVDTMTFWVGSRP